MRKPVLNRSTAMGEALVAMFGSLERELLFELAVCWGLSEGLSEGLGLKVQALLPYQTRHYAADRNALD